MKRLIFATIVALFTTTVSAQSLCSNCNSQQASQGQLPSFTPDIFKPVAIGSFGYGTGYLEEVQVNNTRNLHLYVYMIDVTGKVVKKEITATIIRPPSYWPGEFIKDGTYDPQTLRYYSPKPVGFRLDVRTKKDDGGRPLQNADGSPVVEEKITVSF